MRSKLVIVVAVLALACMFCGACAKKKKKYVPPPPPPPDWSIWADPTAPVALEVTDPTGDNVYGGMEADWLYLDGTFDENYAYIGVDVVDIPGFDPSGDTMYSITVCLHGVITYEPGYYGIVWDGAMGWFAIDYTMNPISMPFNVQFDGAYHLTVAIPRSMCTSGTFPVGAVIAVVIGANPEISDMVPDGGFATFDFNP